MADVMPVCDLTFGQRLAARNLNKELRRVPASPAGLKRQNLFAVSTIFSADM